MRRILPVTDPETGKTEYLLFDTDTSELIYTDNEQRRQYYMTKSRRFFVVYRTGEMWVKTEDEMKQILGATEEGVEVYIRIFLSPKEA